MTPREWIAAATAKGYRLRLSRLDRRPVWVDAPEGGFGDEWDELAPAMRRIGVDAIAEALRAEVFG
ncbi:hypothetical protein [Hansschlegelia beijingensis]|uniref:Uncharacterized protein n=1 Tax=Hansschlegelia beijingensis TaxID=1133344 RepID=A0A7W6CWN7_9HYPH|nr:hypothetical protein [Hansschlegelia beijingensis]MBB3972503.1 hypothetical protein [Hansschlegelia beijingensis]